jgi:hypothetical protein
MHTHPECLRCLLKQAQSTLARLQTPPATAEALTRQTLRILADADYAHSTPRIAMDIYAALNRGLGDPDPFAGIKRQTGDTALELLPGLRQRVEAADDPLRTAVKLALAGNIIDFGVGRSFDLDRTIQEVLGGELALDDVEALRQQLAGGRRVLYLADNAGEIVLDRLLVEQLLPGREVTVALRGGPVINDATRADAEASGLREGDTGGGTLRLIDSGLAMPGTWLERSGEALRRAFDTADVIIAKGQGNFETLHQVEGRPLFFLFMVKCSVVAGHTGLEVGSPVAALQPSLEHGRPGGAAAPGAGPA